MKKAVKTLAIAALAALSACSLAACGKGEDKVTIIPDDNPYTFENKGFATAEMDAGMTIDGKLDEAVWTASDKRWLHGEDKYEDKTAEIDFLAFYGDNGIFFGMNVVEHNNRIWVYHTSGRDSGHINSAVDMYLGPVLEDEEKSKKNTLEFSFVADGQYTSRVNKNGLTEVLGTNDVMPIISTKPIGGEINTKKCRGYTVEAFFPYAFLEFAGWELPKDANDKIDVEAIKKDMTIGINPVHIFSFHEEGKTPSADVNGDRYWSNWASGYNIKASWLQPWTYFHFGKDGLLGYDYKVTVTGGGKGEVIEKNNMSCVLAQSSATFNVKPINGSKITKLTVDGVNYLDRLRQNGELWQFTVDEVTADLEIEAEFDLN